MFSFVPCPNQTLFPEEKTLVEAAMTACISQYTLLPVPKVFYSGVDSDIGSFIIIQDLGSEEAWSRL